MKLTRGGKYDSCTAYLDLHPTEVFTDVRRRRAIAYARRHGRTSLEVWLEGACIAHIDVEKEP